MASTGFESFIATTTLRALGGWKFVGGRPSPKKFVGLAVPHTSNMDGLLMLMLARKVGLDMTWMIKDDWDKPVVGPLIKHYGAHFVNRSKAHGVVDQMIQAFERADELCLVIPPEGTRGRTEYWKSGFYHIALGANVPVVPGYLDYKRKRGGFGEPLTMTGDVKADMDAIRAFYERGDYGPRVPADFGPIRLREEDA